MSNTDMIKELRAITAAGMKDCKDALVEADWDLQKAIDLVKTKGLNVVSCREGKVAAEGRIACTYWHTEQCVVMVEVNCQTDFVAGSPEFADFVQDVNSCICVQHDKTVPFDPKMEHIEAMRQELVSKTKENIVIRRWWIEEVFDDTATVVAYQHPNSDSAKIAGVLSLKASTKDVVESGDLAKFGVDLAMQVVAMNPIAVSPDRLPAEVVERQRAIFEAQLVELNKPQASWAKILEGKMNKWYSEVCLLNQESISLPKHTVAQLVKNKSTELNTEIEVINFIRCQVGEGLETKKENLADEVAKMM
jgi:elongation factor Ts